MKTKTPLFLALLCLSLTACTEPLLPAPVIQHIEVPATLLTCGARPAHPCPQPVAKPPAPPPARQCTEKDRLRWEAMLMHWGDDCESKLRAVKGFLRDVSPPVNPAQKQPQQ